MTKKHQYHPSVYEENLGENHPHPHFDKAHISWIAPEYIQHPKSITWWLAAAIIWLISIVLEAISGNWTMLAATAVFGLVYWYTHEHHPPKHTKINLSELGVKIGHNAIPYDEISCFWIIYDPPYSRRLYLQLKNAIIPDIIIELEEQSPNQVRAFLEQHLTEVVGVKENLSETILRVFKL